MKKLLLILNLALSFAVFGQQNNELLERSKAFHKALTGKVKEVSSFLDDQLSYGHSTGWLESKEQMLDHLASKMMVYKQYTEDSVTVSTDGDVGYLRYVTNLTAELNGNEASFRLKVLEVWRKKNGVWLLIARQAIRAV